MMGESRNKKWKSGPFYTEGRPLFYIELRRIGGQAGACMKKKIYYVRKSSA